MYGVADSFNANIYGDDDPGTVRYLEREVERFESRHGERGGRFMVRAREIFDKFHGDEAFRLARALSRKAKSILLRDIVRRVEAIEDFQQATPLMQRFIMAEEGLRDLFSKQRCSGYEGSYIDMYPGDVGRNHYDWRRIHENVIKDDPDADGEWIMEHFIDDVDPDDVRLTDVDKMDLLDAHEMIRYYREISDSDLTSRTGSKL